MTSVWQAVGEWVAGVLGWRRRIEIPESVLWSLFAASWSGHVLTAEGAASCADEMLEEFRERFGGEG